MSDQPANKPQKGLDRLREEARGYVERMSYTRVARQLEMSPVTLRRFIEGGPLPARAQSRLSRWITVTRQLTDERVRRCIEIVLEIVAELPAHRKLGAVKALMLTLREQFNEGAGAVPLWLHVVIQSIETAGKNLDPDQLAALLNDRLRGGNEHVEPEE